MVVHRGVVALADPINPINDTEYIYYIYLIHLRSKSVVKNNLREPWTPKWGGSHNEWCSVRDPVDIHLIPTIQNLCITWLQVVFRDRRYTVVPLQTLDCKELLSAPNNSHISWWWQFDELRNRTSQVNDKFVNSVPCNPTEERMAEIHSYKEAKNGIKLNSANTLGTHPCGYIKMWKVNSLDSFVSKYLKMHWLILSIKGRTIAWIAYTRTNVVFTAEYPYTLVVGKVFSKNLAG